MFNMSKWVPCSVTEYVLLLNKIWYWNLNWNSFKDQDETQTKELIDIEYVEKMTLISDLSVLELLSLPEFWGFFLLFLFQLAFLVK